MNNLNEAVELHFAEELENGESITILALQEYEVKSHEGFARCSRKTNP